MTCPFLDDFMCNQWTSRLKTTGFLAALFTLLSVGCLHAAEPIMVKENGGWCWFQGKRAVGWDGKVFFTSISGDDHGDWNAGDLVVTKLNPSSGETSHFCLHATLQRDDHAVAGLCLLADGRLLAVYGKHGNDHFQRSRVTLRPGDLSEWTQEQQFDVGAGYTYSNVYRLPGEDDRIFNFHRGRGFNPNCNISDDGGSTWSYGWRLMQRTSADLRSDPRYTGMDGRRPYVCYASHGHDEIHFIATDDHPRAYDNSLYHGYYKAGKLLASDGTVLATPSATSQPLKPRAFTEVFAGRADRVAWASDIKIDANGHPRVAFSVQVDGAATRNRRGAGGLDHRYYDGRWDGTRWHVHEMAYAGTKLYSGEDDYTGLVALDPRDPDYAVISTNADPNSGTPLISRADGQRHWELFAGTTSDSGATWTWTALTKDSSVDNLRPVIANTESDTRVVLWTRGTLRSYTDYHLDIIALTVPR
ncbi:BNR-4 repeat-containing protein [Rhodopirellula sp. JC639]|uniref:BNR-4 repeat-containing protein n=1 Tax=Stieleria mannarensis TaxID=2755585 RepID=UPI001600836E|nr:BNR-4 repeat-containing protein [Rhodopirellula sp. JC639]